MFFELGFIAKFDFFFDFESSNLDLVECESYCFIRVLVLF